MKRHHWGGIVLTVLTAGCIPGIAWFRPGPHPSDIAGIWVDSSKATPTDTVAWVLAPNGDDRTLDVHVASDSAGRAVITRTEKRYGFWFLRGSLADSAGRAICFKDKPRDGASCVAFRLDTLSDPRGGPARRRLLLPGYKGHHHTRDRVLFERLP
jgi:hypothetical protein